MEFVAEIAAKIHAPEEFWRKPLIVCTDSRIRLELSDTNIVTLDSSLESWDLSKIENGDFRPLPLRPNASVIAKLRQQLSHKIDKDMISAIGPGVDASHWLAFQLSNHLSIPIDSVSVLEQKTSSLLEPTDAKETGIKPDPAFMDAAIARSAMDILIRQMYSSAVSGTQTTTYIGRVLAIALKFLSDGAKTTAELHEALWRVEIGHKWTLDELENRLLGQNLVHMTERKMRITDEGAEVLDRLSERNALILEVDFSAQEFERIRQVRQGKIGLVTYLEDVYLRIHSNITEGNFDETCL